MKIFNQEMKNLSHVKNKTYSSKEQKWFVPDLTEFMKYFNVTSFNDIGKDLKYTPYDYQKEAVIFCLEKERVLLVLPCGAGKTMIGICAFDEFVKRNKIKKQGLIVVKSSLKYQWAKEVEKFSNYTVNIIKTKTDLCNSLLSKLKNRQMKYEKTSSEELLKEINDIKQQIEDKFNDQFNYELLIANYEALNNDEIRNKLHSLKLDYVFADEVHSVKSYKAARSKSLYEFGDAKITIGATATPVQKNYEDIFGLFKFINNKIWANFSRFACQFIKYSRPGIISSYKNIDQLRNTISPYLFLKTKEEISSQLPNLSVIQRYCTLDDHLVKKTQEIMIEIDELHEKERQIIAKCKSQQEIENNTDLMTVSARIMALQTFAQELADAPDLLLLSESDMAKQYYVKPKQNTKLDMLYNMVSEIIDSGEKVCIFSKFERIQSLLVDHLKSIDPKMKFALLHGSLNDEQRYNEVYEKFIKQDEYKVLISSDAGSTGLNLSNCKYIIEYDLADSYAIQTQRHGRIERSDSIHDNVFVYQLIAKDSYDEIAYKIVSKKEGYDYELIKRLKE